MSLRIKKGDKVVVLSGKDRGKTGKVIFVFPKKERALVEGVNMMKKHLRKSQQYPQGGIVSQEATVHISKLSLVDSTGKASRIKTLIAKDGSKQRLSAKNKSVL